MATATLIAILAAAGLTYGWQPDPSAGNASPNSGDPSVSDGSLQYIIQISPDAVQGIAKVGQITSAIDPQVRGRISTVVIRIGDGPLPRIDPMADDLQAMSIPEMGTGINHPVAGLPMRRGPRAVMKPGLGDDLFNNEAFGQAADDLRSGVQATVNDAGNQLRGNAAPVPA